MTDTYCVTNDTLGPKACHVNGEHKPGCHNPNCPGCWPRNTERGYVCQKCYDRISEAIPVWHHLENMLDGIDRAITRDAAAQGKPGSRLPFAPIPLDFEAIRSYWASYPGTVDRWVSYETGAADAANFMRSVNLAEKAHPTHEKSHQLRRTRCPDCKQASLVWYPPTVVESPIKVQCQNPACNREIRKTESIDVIAHIEALPAAK